MASQSKFQRFFPLVLVNDARKAKLQFSASQHIHCLSTIKLFLVHRAGCCSHLSILSQNWSPLDPYHLTILSQCAYMHTHICLYVCMLSCLAQSHSTILKYYHFFMCITPDFSLHNSILCLHSFHLLIWPWVFGCWGDVVLLERICLAP